MRSTLALLLVLVAALAPAASGLGLPHASLDAQQPAPSAAEAGAALVEDPEGDTSVTVEAEDQAQSAPAADPQLTGPADIRALSAAESEDALTFTLTLVTLHALDPGGEYRVRFSWGDVRYAAVVILFEGDVADYTDAFLLAERPEGEDRVATLDLAVDAAASTISVTVPKAYVLDGGGRAPVRGDALADVHAVTDRWGQGSIIVTAAWHVTDRAPDDGGATLAFVLGDVAEGHLALSSSDRVRVSNGGSGTLVFRTTLANSGGAADDVALTLEGVPESWSVSAPARVTVPAGAAKDVPVLVTLPFAHQHGGFESFVVHATSATDAASHATLRLGVLHTPIPQPSGHHPDLFLHVEPLNPDSINEVFTYSSYWMATEPSPDSDAPPVPPNNCPGDGVREWLVPLEPALALGLDFDVEKTAALAGALETKEPVTGDLKAALYLMRGAGAEAAAFAEPETFDAARAVLLAGAPEVDFALDATAPKPFAFSLAPTPESDYVPYEGGQNLWLVITLRVDDVAIACSGIATVPHLRPAEFALTLPLNEYRDRLDASADAASGIAVVADGDVERLAAPGTTLAYAFTITNTGDAPLALVLESGGADEARGRVVPGTVSLAAGESRRVTLAVDVPALAVEGQVLEVLLVARDADDPARAAVATTRTTVTLGEGAATDESAEVDAAERGARDTPGLSAGLVVALALGLALARRRR